MRMSGERLPAKTSPAGSIRLDHTRHFQSALICEICGFNNSIRLMRPDFQTLDEITRRLAAAVPREMRTARAELEEQFRAVLESAFDRMDLVTREEFEIQKKVLARTREKLEALERELEARSE
jgi:BMFP domain-containing protein YqiC